MQIPEMERPVFLSGKVVLDDGTAPPHNVTIERICNGVVRPEGYTDSKGHFNLQLGSNMTVFADASVSSSADAGFGNPSSRSGMGSMPGSRNGISERELQNCEIRASLAGYTSETVLLAGRRFMDNPDIGTIILRRMGKVDGYTLSVTNALAPKDAKKAYEKAREAMKKNKAADAQKELEKAVGIYPKYASAWFSLGLVKEQTKDIEGARKAYAEALAADPKYVNPYMQLAQLDANESKWQQVVETTDRLLKLDAYNFPRAYFLNSVANLNLKKIDEAEVSARAAVKSDPNNRNPQTHHLLGVILAQKEQFPEAATEMKTYLKLAPNANNAVSVKKQLVEIEKITASPETAEKKKEQ